jgi:hypothetical protein
MSKMLDRFTKNVEAGKGVNLTLEDAAEVEALLILLEEYDQVLKENPPQQPEPTEILCLLCGQWHEPSETLACEDFDPPTLIMRYGFPQQPKYSVIEPQPAWESRRIRNLDHRLLSSEAWTYEIGRLEERVPIKPVSMIVKDHTSAPTTSVANKENE